MAGVLATEDLWKKERGAIEQEVARDLSDPMYVFHTRLLAKMFAGTPFATDALGTKASFDKTTGAMLRKFHEQWYGPNNAILFIVGDVDPEPTMAMVRQLFAGIPRRPVPPRPQSKLAPLAPASLDMETDLPYGLAVVAYRLPGYDSPDYAAGQILGDVLDSQRARLYDLVTEGAALSAGFSEEERAPATLGYAAAAFPKGGDGAALVTRLKKIIEDYRRNGVPADLVTAAKAQEIAAAQFAKNSTHGLAFAWSAGRGRGGTELSGRRYRGDPGGDRGRGQPGGPAISARRKRPSPRSSRPGPSGRPVAGTGRTGKGGLCSQGGQSRWRCRPGPRASRCSRSRRHRLRPMSSGLNNGLRLLVLPSEVSPTVSLYGEVRNRPSMQEPQGKEGVASVLADLFSYGTTTLDRLAYQKALDEIAASASAGTDFSLQALADKFEQGRGPAGRQSSPSGLAGIGLCRGPAGTGRLPGRRTAEPGLSCPARPAHRAVSCQRSDPAGSHSGNGEGPDVSTTSRPTIKRSSGLT